MVSRAHAELAKNMGRDLPRWLSLGADDRAYESSVSFLCKSKNSMLLKCVTSGVGFAIDAAALALLNRLIKLSPDVAEFICSLVATTLLLFFLKVRVYFEILGGLALVLVLYFTVRKKYGKLGYGMSALCVLLPYGAFLGVNSSSNGPGVLRVEDHMKDVKLADYTKIDPAYRERLLSIVASVGVARNMITVQTKIRPNAGAMSFSTIKYIVIHESMFRLLTPEQLAAVLYHEAGHIKHKHVPSIMKFLGGTLLITVNISGILGVCVAKGLSLLHGMYVCAVSFGLLFKYSSWIENYYFRAPFEFQADAFAAANGMAGDLASGLLSLSAYSFFFMLYYPSSLYSFVTHPSIMERYNRLMEYPLLHGQQ